jgi:serine/threonine protein phosphatase 1
MIWKKKPAATVPAGQRIYAIGDIHGRLDLLDQLLAMIVDDDAGRGPMQRRTLLFLGDYVDRGAESAGVLDRLIGGMPDGFECICLKGNHEEIMMLSMTDAQWLYNWAQNGGLKTLESYGVEAAMRDVEQRPKDVSGALIAALPDRHLAFLQGLSLTASFGDYFFVHAGVHPSAPLTMQRKDDCLYIREPFLSHKGSYGKIVVHGHTPVKEPEIRANRIGIDTGAYFTEHLTALRLEGNSRAFLAT